MPSFLIYLLVFLLGICVGSFLNVCIFRLPSEDSITNPPRSVCPHCRNSIPFYDNIPLFSYFWLRGKCRSCGGKISFRYPMVELMGGIFALAIFRHYGFSLPALIYFVLICSLVVITFIDLDYGIIPDVITLPGIPIGLAASLVLPSISIFNALLGILAGGGTLFMVAWIYSLITGKEGMGGGDIKLLAMLGPFLGWKGVFFTIFAASVVGMLAGIIEMIRHREGMKLAIPFGPFISIGAILYIFYGPGLMTWYWNFIRAV